MFFFDFLVPNIYSIILSIVSFLWFGSFSINYILEKNHPVPSDEKVIVSSVHPSSPISIRSVHFDKIKKNIQQQYSPVHIQKKYVPCNWSAPNIIASNHEVCYVYHSAFALFSRPPPCITACFV